MGTVPLALTPAGADTFESLAAPYAVPAASSPLFPTVTASSDGSSAWWITGGIGAYEVARVLQPPSTQRQDEHHRGTGAEENHRRRLGPTAGAGPVRMWSVNCAGSLWRSGKVQGATGDTRRDLQGHPEPVYAVWRAVDAGTAACAGVLRDTDSLREYQSGHGRLCAGRDGDGRDAASAAPRGSSYAMVKGAAGFEADSTGIMFTSPSSVLKANLYV